MTYSQNIEKIKILPRMLYPEKLYLRYEEETAFLYSKALWSSTSTKYSSL